MQRYGRDGVSGRDDGSQHDGLEGRDGLALLLLLLPKATLWLILKQRWAGLSSILTYPYLFFQVVWTWTWWRRSRCGTWTSTRQATGLATGSLPTTASPPPPCPPAPSCELPTEIHSEMKIFTAPLTLVEPRSWGQAIISIPYSASSTQLWYMREWQTVQWLEQERPFLGKNWVLLKNFYTMKNRRLHQCTAILRLCIALIWQVVSTSTHNWKIVTWDKFYCFEDTQQAHSAHPY